MKRKIKIKRVYDRPQKADGKRILVDRLWPRGLSKNKAQIDLWLKELAPSVGLRKWFNHDPKKWTVFQRRYRTELKHNKNQLARLKKEVNAHSVSLVYTARDEQHNNAMVLAMLLGA